jgi:uncharacterized protein YegL
MGWAKYREDLVSRWVQDNPEAATPQNQECRSEKISFKEKEMTKLNEFTMSSARPLPVILLADVSGSMTANGKIEALNDAVSEMIATFAEEDDTKAEIHVSVVTFGSGGAKLHKPLQPASDATWENMTAAGRTPMGEAFTTTREIIENRDVIPSRAYRPTVVLVSDGIPTDDWEAPLNTLLQSERASKASRFAMGIGEDADKKTLEAFLAGEDSRVFEAHEAREIKKFFRWVTMSVTTRSRSTNPNTVVVADPTDLDDFEF